MKNLLIVLGSLLVLVVILVSLTVESQPTVVNHDQATLESAQQVKNLIRKLRYKVQPRPQKFSLTVTATEFHALGAFGQRALPELRVKTRLEDDAAVISVSLELPAPFQEKYLNGKLVLLTSDQGLLISQIKLGKFTIESQWGIAMLIKLVNQLMNDLPGDIIAQINQVKISQHWIVVHVSPDEPLMQQLNQLAVYFGLQGKSHEKRLIHHYYQFLERLPEVLPAERNLSLIAYLKPLINEAARRSDKASAAEENRSALLALGYFAGHRHFAGVIGSFAGIQREPVKPHRLLLAGRHDLQQHFLYSALFKLLSDQGVSNMLGELKELMDSGRGGSGFSFADLAADLGGTRFAEFASDKKTAYQFQAAFAEKITERWIFPKISDLEEGLSSKDFRAYYGEVDSPEYLRIIDDIQSRIDDLPLYNHH